METFLKGTGLKKKGSVQKGKGPRQPKPAKRFLKGKNQLKKEMIP
jgi:hypothetical protein